MHGKKGGYAHTMSTLVAQDVHPTRSPVPTSRGDRMERGAAESSSALSVRSTTPSPSQLLRRGNSDPFGAAALQVTATVNELMRSVCQSSFESWRIHNASIQVYE